MKSILFRAFFILTLLSIFVVTKPVYADDSSISVVKGGSFDRYTDDSNEVVYTLSVPCSLSNPGRDNSNKIIKPSNGKLTITNGANAYNNLSVEMGTNQGNQDIALSIDKTSLAAKGSLTITVNFKRTDIEPCMLHDTILLKSNGEVVKTIKFRYDTPGYLDEHDYDLNQWNGTYFLDSNTGYQCQIVGTLDLYQSNQTVSVTYKENSIVPPGEYAGVKRFFFYNTTNNKSNFEFSNNSNSYTASNQNAGASNTVKIRIKDSTTRKALRNEIKAAGSGYTDMPAPIDMVVEYRDGCYAGDAGEGVPIAVNVTLRPSGKVQSVKTSKQTTSSIKISWSKFSSANGYVVYRSTKKSSGYKKIATVSSSKNYYTDKKLKTGKTYYYKVKAYRNVNGTKYYSSSSTALKSTTRTKAPTISVKKQGKKIRVKYKKVSGASGYRIYVRQGKKGKFSYTITTTKRSSLTKTLKKGKTYYVKVRAYKTVNGKKVASSYSVVKQIKL